MDRIVDMEVKDGKFRVKVAGRTVVAQKMPVEPKEIAKAFQAAAGGGKPVAPVRPIAPAAGARPRR